jgi:ATP-dependent Lon protease
MSSLLLIPLDDTVVFPTMDVTLPVDVDGEERVLLVPRHDGEYAKVGTVASVTETVRIPGGGRGLARAAGAGDRNAKAAPEQAKGPERLEERPGEDNGGG